MKAKISEYMDGELEGSDAARALSDLREDGEGREAWRTYHMIGDALRDTRALSPRFAARLGARLAEEPTVLAPVLEDVPVARRRGLLIPLAASAAAVGMVGWLAFAPQPQAPSRSGPPLASTPQIQPTPVAVVPEPVRVPLPHATDDYLLAHQASSRNLLQGVVPYVRTVSGRSAENKR